jgi:predicted nucleic acid-binding protein
VRVALDTNVLAYAEGVNEPEQRTNALHVIRSFPSRDVHVPVQVLGELFLVLMRKSKRTADDARGIVEMWRSLMPSIETTADTVTLAAELVGAHRLAFWDAVIVAASVQAGCRLLLSEDMQEGFTWRGTTVVNPFAQTPHPLLAGNLRR